MVEQYVHGVSASAGSGWGIGRNNGCDGRTRYSGRTAYNGCSGCSGWGNGRDLTASRRTGPGAPYRVRDAATRVDQ
ncbi:hypothetical protein GCM10010326_55100 [Streptomyces xanthochromogenes]|uniref:Uncharacterized protein n=1 Tax=Streptomyces xanthochromogenes TaxID=67384 RepID=A0ABQ3ALA1_9ACTN|nr:hypothetical protein GCM10010326_55100 [Streptomyces xanthochromogenes]